MIQVFIIVAGLAALVWICWRWSIARAIRNGSSSSRLGKPNDPPSTKLAEPDVKITDNLQGRIMLNIQPGEKLTAHCIASRLGIPGSTKNIAVVLRKLRKMGVVRARRGLGRHRLFSLKTGPRQPYPSRYDRYFH